MLQLQPHYRVRPVNAVASLRRKVVFVFLLLQSARRGLASGDIEHCDGELMAIEDYIEVVHPNGTQDRHLKVELLCADHCQCPGPVTEVPEIVGKRGLQQPSSYLKADDFP